MGGWSSQTIKPLLRSTIRSPIWTECGKKRYLHLNRDWLIGNPFRGDPGNKSIPQRLDKTSILLSMAVFLLDTCSVVPNVCVCGEGGGVVWLFVSHGMYINHFFFFFTADFRAFFCFLRLAFSRWSLDQPIPLSMSICLLRSLLFTHFGDTQEAELLLIFSLFRAMLFTHAHFGDTQEAYILLAVISWPN